MVSLIDPLEYMIQPEFALGGGTIIGLSYDNSSMPKHYQWSPLCRVYWTQAPTAELCINGITEVVNAMYQNTLPYLVDPCATVNGLGGVLAGSVLQVNPNPVQSGEALILNFAGGSLSGAEVRWMDLTGRVLEQTRWAGAERFVLGTDGRAAGSYFIQVVQTTRGGDILHTRRITVR